MAAILLPPNPNSLRISSAIWRLWNEFDAHEPPALLGGIYANKGGYHNYRNALANMDYSVRLTADRRGSSTHASGLDISMPPSQMKTYTGRLDRAARKRDPRLYTPAGPVLREFIGTKDGTTVYCYVLVGGEMLGVGADAGPDPGRDESHIWHIHLSFIRQFLNDWAALSGVLSVLVGQPLAEWQEDQEFDMAKIDDIHHTTTSIPGMIPEDPDKRVPLHVAMPQVFKAIKAVGDAVSVLDDDVAARIKTEFDQIDTALADVGENVLATPSQVIAQLTAVGTDAGSDALIAALGPAEARAFAQAVLDKTE
jgi:hypothetical protein